MFDEKKREIAECYAQDTVGRKYSTKFTTTPKSTYKPTTKAKTVSFNINSPVDWKTLSKMSQETQRMYIERCRDEYAGRSRWIAAMLGISENWFTVICSKLGVSFRGVRKYSEADAWEVWERFLHQESAVVAICEPPENEAEPEAPVETMPEEPENIIEEPEEYVDEQVSLCNKAMFEFQGNVDPVYLAAMIETVRTGIGNCKITVTVERV